MVSLALVICSIALDHSAFATHHLVGAGNNWQDLTGRIRPGDEIILMPGRHRGAVFDSLRGTPEKPITIRSVDAEHPAEIVAERCGIHVSKAAHLIIRDLRITGGTICGISLGEEAAAKSSPSALSASGESSPAEAITGGQIQLRNLSISKVGPRGQRHAIVLHHLADVRIDGCRIQGWGGSAIEIVACTDVSIYQCALKGLDDHSQLCGIRARAGAARVQIERCRLENAGDIGLSLGGKTDPFPFPAETSEQPDRSAAAEVSSVTVEECLIIDSDCAVAFINAEDCVVRNNTIHRPRRTVLALLDQHGDPRITPGQRCILGANLIVWKTGDIQTLAEVDEKIARDALALEENLWLSDDPPPQREKLGPMPGVTSFEQTIDVDPKLDERHRPREPQAQAFGVQTQ